MDVAARDLVRSHLRWRVHSVFTRALNLVNEDDTLIGIVAAPAGNGPATLVLGEGPPQPLSSLVVQGEPARRAGQSLGVGHRVEIDLAGAALWCPPPIRRTVTDAELAARIDRLQGIVRVNAPPGGLWPLLGGTAATAVAERAAPLVHLMALAARTGAWTDLRAPARDLSGLGPGLTPSGDDFLAGFALAVRVVRGGLPDEAASALRDAVVGRTTDLAVARVHHAAAGRPDEAVYSLLSLLLSEPEPGPSLDAAVRAALDYGHSSGADTLVGLVVGLSLAL